MSIENVRLKMEGERTPKEIFEAGDFDTSEEQYMTGKEMGFSDAKNSNPVLTSPILVESVSKARRKKGRKSNRSCSKANQPI